MQLLIDTLPRDSQKLVESLQEKVEARTASDEESEQYWAWIDYLKEVDSGRVRQYFA